MKNAVTIGISYEDRERLKTVVRDRFIQRHPEYKNVELSYRFMIPIIIDYFLGVYT